MNYKLSFSWYSASFESIADLLKELAKILEAGEINGFELEYTIKAESK